MQTAILTLHVIVCLILVILVLLQSGREGMGVIFGGGGNTSVFGSAGAGGVLVKLTAFLAALFIVTSLGYNIITSTGRSGESTILDVQFEDVPAPAQVQPEPVTDSQPAPAPVVETPTSTESAPLPEATPEATVDVPVVTEPEPAPQEASTPVEETAGAAPEEAHQEAAAN